MPIFSKMPVFMFRVENVRICDRSHAYYMPNPVQPPIPRLRFYLSQIRGAASYSLVHRDVRFVGTCHLHGDTIYLTIRRPVTSLRPNFRLMLEAVAARMWRCQIHRARLRSLVRFAFHFLQGARRGHCTVNTCLNRTQIKCKVSCLLECLRNWSGISLCLLISDVLARCNFVNAAVQQ